VKVFEQAGAIADAPTAGLLLSVRVKNIKIGEYLAK